MSELNNSLSLHQFTLLCGLNSKVTLMLLHIDKKLKQLRAERNLTLKEVSEKIGITAGLLQHYEAGRCEPRLKTLAKICDFFEVSADYFLSNHFL